MKRIRAVREEEREQIATIYTNAYRIGLEMARGWANDADLKNSRAIFAGKRLVSILQIIPFRVWLGRNLVPMGGISGVATWADCQGQGYAGMLMKDSLHQMRKRCESVSVLYPFSFSYYRKFGWELAGREVFYKKFRQEQVIAWPERVLVEAYLDATDFSALNEVYEQYAQRFNLCASRDKRIWERRFKWLEKHGGQVYIIRDGKKPIGYFFCQNKPLEIVYESITREFAVLNKKALKAMFGFLAALPNNVTQITVAAPYSLELWPFLKEPYIETEMKPTMQFRVVDVAKALVQRGYNDSINGKVVIKIDDPVAPWNKGNWELEIMEGKPKVKKTNKRAEVICSIQVFSQLYCGYAHPRRLIEEENLEVKDAAKLSFLTDCFFDRSTHIMDWF